MAAPRPTGFKAPEIEKYNGKKDPAEHVDRYNVAMLLYGVSDAMYCRAFASTLTDEATIWFSNLPPGRYSNFDQLAKDFVAHFASGKRHRKTIAHLMHVK